MKWPIVIVLWICGMVPMAMGVAVEIVASAFAEGRLLADDLMDRYL